MRRESIARILLLLTTVGIIIGGSSAQDDNGNNGVNIKKKKGKQFHYVCPADFIRAGKYCYYLSSGMATWHQAHFNCKDRDAELATPRVISEDQALRAQLNRPVVAPLEWWIGGIYDWEQMLWKWGGTGERVGYQAFSRMGADSSLRWHCLILDPALKYRWNARSCVEGKHFICQKRLKRITHRELREMQRRNQLTNHVSVPWTKNANRNHIKNKKKKHHDRNRDENLSNVREEDNLRLKQPNVAYAMRPNATSASRNGTRKGRKGYGRKKLRQRQQLQQQQQQQLKLLYRNGTDFSPLLHNATRNGGDEAWKRRRDWQRRQNMMRRRRNKSKEENNSIEKVTHRTWFIDQKYSHLHPHQIVEEHEFNVVAP